MLLNANHKPCQVNSILQLACIYSTEYSLQQIVIAYKLQVYLQHIIYSFQQIVVTYRPGKLYTFII